MAEHTKLDIHGYQDEPVPNEFIRADGETTTLAMMLPGVGYTNAMPLLFYTEALLDSRNVDVLLVNYTYRNLPESTTQGERETRLYDDVAGAVMAGFAQRQYTRFVLVGKSLGTMAMEHLIGNGIDVPTSYIWHTPLSKNPDVHRVMEQTAHSSFVSIGTNDGSWDADVYADLEARGAHVHVVEGADHGMMVDDDVPGSVDVMTALVHELDTWLGQRMEAADGGTFG